MQRRYQPFSRDRRGIIIHDACWILLEEALRPAPVPLQRLLEVCNSLPIPCRCNALAWVYKLGGTAAAGHRDPFFGTNPWQVPEVNIILAEDPEQPPMFQQTASSFHTLSIDCFVSLPQELCAPTAMHLPTADVLRAHLASRAFWPIFHSQQFWASRFKYSPDRSWLFEARSSPPSDWRWLYGRINNAFIGPGLRNRRRIWGLLQEVPPILALAWNELPPVLPTIWSPDPGLSPVDNRVEAAEPHRDTSKSTSDDFSNSCRIFRTQTIAVPAQLARISAHTFAFGDEEYIVGMSLTIKAGDTLCLGYRSPSAHSVELSEIWGLRLAMGPRGLRVLQCITGQADSESPWLGSPDDIPLTERLVAADRIGCKMVSIGAYPGSRHCTEVLEHGSRLRASGLWYPTIPPRNLCLNEESFPLLELYATGYKPLFGCHFGGPGGKYLPHMTGIWATSSIGGILRIQFRFDKEVRAECRSFGRLKEKDEEAVVDISIDGPGGERIEAIRLHNLSEADEFQRTSEFLGHRLGDYYHN
ncbi:uncharacterized protein B0T15DRAFT_549385 [Chaetomium strumarium]|uniref:DUF7600 domain-containing protein n=1 Tax=Chaetomium strumarium TaxID=1170767 RepID=A0AAJ0M7A0_9PEZI|nr:hypothetical protein B0T15DRAFT_549385 [Chaetomium strumarium]